MPTTTKPVFVVLDTPASFAIGENAEVRAQVARKGGELVADFRRYKRGRTGQFSYSTSGLSVTPAQLPEFDRLVQAGGALVKLSGNARQAASFSLAGLTARTPSWYSMPA